ncbi:MAG: hypothetical protein CO128_03245 [Ignavibacteriales bacterium CG_4_9_14_3_um_filter_30_11]|nr:MAG: hypothetical protein CO128_03245 [Ignavibacteriales bacterium CG_4_9_14_3_um_filter_30_11]
MKYIEIAKGALNNRGYIIQSNKLINYVKPQEELYRSYFSFDEKIKLHISSGRKTPAGYVGEFYIDQIVLDIDKGSNSDEYTLAKAKDLVSKLMDMYSLSSEQIAFWFSGTGYHIHIPDIFEFTPSNELPHQVKDTLNAVFPEADTKPVNPRGLIRVGMTLNEKSQLYKTYIKTTEIWFMTYSDIYAIAKEQNLGNYPKSFPKLSKTFPHLIQKTKKDIVTLNSSLEDPTRLVTCMQKVYMEGEKVGTRHERMIRMSSWLRRSGIPLKLAITGLQAHFQSLSPYEVEKTVVDIYKKGYSFSCQDEIMAEFCDSRCIFYKKKDLMPSILSSRDLEKKFTKFIQSDWQKSSINLKNFLEISSDYWIIPEDLVGLIGDTGLNKTAFAQNLAVYLEDLAPILYVNTEFGSNLLFRRFVQIAHNMSKKEVIEHYRANKNKLSEKFRHIHYLNSVPSIDELEDLVKRHNPKFLILDTIDDIIKAKKTGLDSEDAVAKQLSQLNKKYSIMTMAIHHISKHAAFDDKGNSKILNIHSGKGSSSFEQKCDIVLGIEGKQEDKIRVIKSLKGRDNYPFTTTKYLNQNTFKLERGEDE